MKKRKNKWYVKPSRLFSAGIFVGLFAYLIPKDKIPTIVNQYIIFGLLGLLYFAIYKFWMAYRATKDKEYDKYDWTNLIKDG